MSVPPDGGSQSVGEPRGAPQPRTGAGEDADVHAFLIGDVRGWTSFTQEHGDEGAARLAARFAEVTRAVVEDHRGRVVELRGDEVLAVFGSPRSAIRAAVALQQRYLEWSLDDPNLILGRRTREVARSVFKLPQKSFLVARFDYEEGEVRLTVFPSVAEAVYWRDELEHYRNLGWIDEQGHLTDLGNEHSKPLPSKDEADPE